MKHTISERIEQLKKIKNEVLTLKKSPLYKYRMENKYFPVIGEGSLVANIMFVGEAPGKTEAETGKPFCGRSGKFLDELLESIKLKRADVYITNIVKDRPQDNRDPTSIEITLYGPYLDQQIEIIQPKIIVTLGRLSGAYIFSALKIAEKMQPIGKIHGQEFIGSTGYGKVIILPLYHPAVALYNGSNRATLMLDFQVLKKYI